MKELLYITDDRFHRAVKDYLEQTFDGEGPDSRLKYFLRSCGIEVVRTLPERLRLRDALLDLIKNEKPPEDKSV